MWTSNNRSETYNDLKMKSFPVIGYQLLQQKKQQYFENLNLSSITDKLFWKTASPFFTEKIGSKNNKITLVEGGKVLTDDAKIAETFNSFFGNNVNTLNTEKDESVFCYFEILQLRAKFQTAMVLCSGFN